MRRLIAEHRRAALLVALFLVVAAVIVLVWFEPQKLFIDETVDEAVPGAAADPDGGDEDGDSTEGSGDEDPSGSPEPTSEPETSGPETLAEADFRALDHEARGRALFLDVEGDRYLRFEDFEVENGPDLKVYLSSAPADGDDSAFDDDFVDLGELKGNIGAQNYKIPADVDLSEYSSAVVWCRRFSVGFAVADLS